jgi:hypothetical protein
MNTRWTHYLPVLATLALALPAQATPLADRQLAWIKDHDGREIIAPDGSILVPIVAVSNLLWLEPDGSLRDVGLIARDPKTGDVLLSWSEFGVDRITDDPASDAFAYEATDRTSPLAETFQAITETPLKTDVARLPAGAWLEPAGTIRLTGSDASEPSRIIGQWQFRGPTITLALGGEDQISVSTQELLSATQPD